jgi:hypothetical protein
VVVGNEDERRVIKMIHDCFFVFFSFTVGLLSCLFFTDFFLYFYCALFRYVLTMGSPGWGS